LQRRFEQQVASQSFQEMLRERLHKERSRLEEAMLKEVEDQQKVILDEIAKKKEEQASAEQAEEERKQAEQDAEAEKKRKEVEERARQDEERLRELERRQEEQREELQRKKEEEARLAADKALLLNRAMPQPTNVSTNWLDYLPTQGDDADWDDDYSPSAEELESKKLPSPEECEEICTNYEFDWGWELHKYARLNRPIRVRKVLRYTITLGASKASGKDAGCLNWQEEPFGHTALWWTASHGNWELMKELLDVGADPSIADADGYTPLIVAAQEGHDECVQILLAYGVDVNHKMADGDTALDKAEAFSREDCVTVLKEHLEGLAR